MYLYRESSTISKSLKAEQDLLSYIAWRFGVMGARYDWVMAKKPQIDPDKWKS
jgi:hypothetical protein